MSGKGSLLSPFFFKLTESFFCKIFKPEQCSALRTKPACFYFELKPKKTFT